MGRTIRIGALVTAAIIVLMVTIFSLGAEQRFWERKVQYEVHFTRTGGLQVGSQVSLNGVLVGSVVEMRFPPDPAVNFIQVLVNVRGDVSSRIRDDTLASIRTYGLLGDRYIEMSAGSPEAAPIPPGGLIASVDPVDIESLVGQGGDIVTNIVEVTASLKDVLGTIQRGEGLLGAMLRNRELGESTLVDLQRTMANVQDTTKSLDQILDRVNRGRGVLGQMTGDSPEAKDLASHVRRAARSIDEFSSRLNRGNGALVRLVEDEAYARRVLSNLDHAVADLADVAAKLDRGQGTLGKLVNDPTLYHETRALVGGFRGSWLLRFFGSGKSAPPPPPSEPPPASAPAPPPGGTPAGDRTQP
jgi:phospholipid/cholesterol/gamma-HCH transport system substrate-binding protein